MKRTPFLSSLLLSALLFSQPGIALSVHEKFAAGGSVHLHLESGGYTVRPTDSDAIIVTYSAGSDAEEKAVKVRIRTSGAHADVYVENTPSKDFQATIEVPRRSSLWTRLIAGQLTVENVEGDKDIEMRAGQLSISVPKPEDYGHRDASVTSGAIEAPIFNISKGGLFRSFRQDGQGKYRLHAHVTAGEIDLHSGA